MIVEPNTDRIIPRRRALLLAGVGLGSLGLAACGGNSSSNETSGKDNSSSSSASETPQDSNSTTPSASGEASTSSASEGATATPDPNFSKGYSGGEKAPEGEYREADLQGPAQNVPKPAMPEDGYKLATVEGLEKSVHAWVNWKNYGIQTGDYSIARQFVSTQFTEETEYMDTITKLYERGGWVKGGVAYFEFHGEPIIKDDGVYQWEFYRLWKEIMQIEPNGRYRKSKNTPSTNNLYWLQAKNDGNGWKILSIKGA